MTDSFLDFSYIMQTTYLMIQYLIIAVEFFLLFIFNVVNENVNRLYLYKSRVCGGNENSIYLAESLFLIVSTNSNVLFCV